jgi:multimeric flavodoxin WrbA
VEHQVEKAGYTPVAGSVTRADGTIEAMHRKAENDASKAGLVTRDIRVAGNCEMCQARIEKAALNHQGVFNALWNKETKMLTVGYDDSTTSPEAIEKAIAMIGHDTEHHRAHEETYNNLPACCHYERIDAGAK